MSRKITKYGQCLLSLSKEISPQLHIRLRRDFAMQNIGKYGNYDGFECYSILPNIFLKEACLIFGDKLSVDNPIVSKTIKLTKTLLENYIKRKLTETELVNLNYDFMRYHLLSFTYFILHIPEQKLRQAIFSIYE